MSICVADKAGNPHKRRAKLKGERRRKRINAPFVIIPVKYIKKKPKNVRKVNLGQLSAGTFL